MAIEITWDNQEHTIIYVTFPEEWTWDEYSAVDSITEPMLDSVNHKVCYIADLRQTQHVPKGLRLDIAREILEFRHDNSDLLVIIGMNSMIRALLDIVLMALGKVRTQIVIVDNIDEAYEKIFARQVEISQGDK